MAASAIKPLRSHDRIRSSAWSFSNPGIPVQMLAPVIQPREAVAKVIASWKIKQGQDDRRDKDSQQRERGGG